MKNTTNVFSHVHLRSWYLITWSMQSGIQWIQKKEPSMDLPQKQECLQQPIKATTCTSTPKSKLPNGSAIQLRRSIPSNSHNPSQLYKALASRASSFSPRVMTTHHSKCIIHPNQAILGHDLDIQPIQNQQNPPTPPCCGGARQSGLHVWYFSLIFTSIQPTQLPHTKIKCRDPAFCGSSCCVLACSGAFAVSLRLQKGASWVAPAVLQRVAAAAIFVLLLLLV